MTTWNDAALKASLTIKCELSGGSVSDPATELHDKTCVGIDLFKRNLICNYMHAILS
jgi:hypothetical protein